MALECTFWVKISLTFKINNTCERGTSMFKALDTNLWCSYKTHAVYFPHTSKIRESSCLWSFVFLPFMYFLFYQSYFVKEKSFDLEAVKSIQVESRNKQTQKKVFAMILWGLVNLVQCVTSWSSK